MSIQGCQRYPAVSDAFPYGCKQLPRVFHGIVKRNEFHSQYPVFDGIEGIGRYSKFAQGYCNTVEYRQIPSNTAKYYIGTRLKDLHMHFQDLQKPLANSFLAFCGVNSKIAEDCGTEIAESLTSPPNPGSAIIGSDTTRAKHSNSQISWSGSPAKMSVM